MYCIWNTTLILRIVSTMIPYTYKFSRGINFAVFTVNLVIQETQGVITSDP